MSERTPPYESEPLRAPFYAERNQVRDADGELLATVDQQEIGGFAAYAVSRLFAKAPEMLLMLEEARGQLKPELAVRLSALRTELGEALSLLRPMRTPTVASADDDIVALTNILGHIVQDSPELTREVMAIRTRARRRQGRP